MTAGKRLTVEDIAAVCHEANRAYCRAIGDFSQPPWESAAPWIRGSGISGVKFHLVNFNAGPEQSHENWLKDKQADGWIWGAVKDASKKQHPCMLPFAELPPEQRAKDHLFRAIVHAIVDGGVLVRTPDLGLPGGA